MAFCTQGDLETRASALGIQLWTDDELDGATDTDAVDQAIEAGDADVAFYCGWLYSDTQLADCTWVKHAAIALSLWYLCGRRFDSIPASVQANYERVIKQLERVQDGKAKLPGIALRNKHTPGLTNQRVDMGYRRKKLRVERTISPEQSPQHSQDRDFRGDVEVGP